MNVKDQPVSLIVPANHKLLEFYKCCLENNSNDPNKYIENSKVDPLENRTSADEISIKEELPDNMNK